jgi:hypothetical protein
MSLVALVLSIIATGDGDDRGRRGRTGPPGPPGPPGPAGPSNTSLYGFEWSIPLGFISPLGSYGATLYALSNDPTYDPTYFPSTSQYQSYFVSSKNVTLTSIHLKANYTYYDTSYNIQGIDGPYNIPFSLYVNSAFVAVLGYFPPAIVTGSGQTTNFDVVVSGLNYPILTNQDMSFIIDLTQWVNGTMAYMIIGIGFQESIPN